MVAVLLLFATFSLVTLLAALRVASDADDYDEKHRNYKEEK